MKTHYTKARSVTGPIFHSASVIEYLCSSELHKMGLMPDKPGPVNIERFVEKRFGFYDFKELDEGVLGYTKFSERGVEEIIISRALADENTKVSNRRVRTTLAHESGHAMLHGRYFTAAGMNHRSLFESSTDSEGPLILCRETEAAEGEGSKKTKSNRWEIQANMTIGALLLPKKIFLEAVRLFLNLGEIVPETYQFKEEQREEAARALAEVFDVNPAVVRIRLAHFFPLPSV